MEERFVEIFIFNDVVYYNVEDLNEALQEHILKNYPEAVHSDYDAEESSEFEDLFHHEVQQVEVSVEKINQEIGGV